MRNQIMRREACDGDHNRRWLGSWLAGGRAHGWLVAANRPGARHARHAARGGGASCIRRSPVPLARLEEERQRPAGAPGSPAHAWARARRRRPPLASPHTPSPCSRVSSPCRAPHAHPCCALRRACRPRLLPLTRSPRAVCPSASDRWRCARTAARSPRAPCARAQRPRRRRRRPRRRIPRRCPTVTTATFSRRRRPALDGLPTRSSCTSSPPESGVGLAAAQW